MRELGAEPGSALGHYAVGSSVTWRERRGVLRCAFRTHAFGVANVRASLGRLERSPGGTWRRGAMGEGFAEVAEDDSRAAMGERDDKKIGKFKKETDPS